MTELAPTVSAESAAGRWRQRPAVSARFGSPHGKRHRIPALRMGTFRCSFGGSHDGRNAATWGVGSRSLRENGLRSLVLARYRRTRCICESPPRSSLSRQHFLRQRAARAGAGSGCGLGGQHCCASLAIRSSKGPRNRRPHRRSRRPLDIYHRNASYLRRHVGHVICALPFTVAFLLVWSRAVRGMPVRWWTVALFSFLPFGAGELAGHVGAGYRSRVGACGAS